MKKETGSVFGISTTPRSSIGIDEIRADLEADAATILTDAGSSLILACWDGAGSVSSGTDGIVAAHIGNPRLRGGDSGPAAALDAIVDRFRDAGPDIPIDVVGNFSVAVVDAGRKRVLLAIDRLGIESMYYRPFTDGSIAFSTDLDVLKRYTRAELSLSRQAIYDYAYLHVVPAPLTIYAGIFKLPPSHALGHASGEVSAVRYWTPTFAASTQRNSAELNDELMQTLRAAVARSVELSEGRIGGFLSGGLDSSTICGLLAGVSDEPATAVSVGFDQAGYDEIAYARAAAGHFGLEHCVHYITPDEVADSIPLIAAKYAEPFGNSSAVPTYICALTARQNGISTMLAGDGGDELFAGNSRYVRQQIFEVYGRLPAALRSYVLQPLFSGRQRPWHVGPLRKLYRYVDQAVIPLPDRLYSDNLVEMTGPGTMYSADFLAEVDVSHPHRLMREEFSAAAEDTDVLDRMLHFDWRFTLADNDIRKVSQMCELAGVAVRYPLMDDDVVDFSLRVPPGLKIRRFRLRHFYRQALSDFLPHEVIDKSKHGFGLPFGEWLLSSSRLQEVVYDALTDLRKRDIFRRSFIDALIDNHRHDHSAYFGTTVWVLAMLEWWLDAHR